MTGIWGDTVTLVRRVVVGRDRYGNDVYDETRETITGCSWQPLDSAERADQTQDQTVMYYDLYIPGLDVDVDAVDAFEHDGVRAERAEVHGPASYNRSASGLLDHIAVRLQQIKG
ncbi:hypothetical protein [Nocardiopsis sp. FR26]|uniref:hypothetical protein n=1 Tax=Nocardiopsis sp. FR26 TaxID=2605987 RepID=UPI001359BEFA|nr:hypothetical protein [Nocardiopsis sp. FR26]